MSCSQPALHAPAFLAALVVSISFTTLAAAQQPAPPAVVTPGPEPFQILDNSFLVEEAFNQEAGIFQNIFNAVVTDGVWAMSFVQEWPVASQTHQLSYSLTWAAGDGSAAFGDTLLNYRFQALTEAPGRPAFSPRVSAVLPTASGVADLNAWGVQLNLPFSKQTGDFYWHWNAGITWLPSVDLGNDSLSLESPFLGGSSIYRVAPMFHLMFEAVAAFNEEFVVDETTRPRTMTLSPGARGGWNLGDHQLILGVAIPTSWTSNERRETAVLVYLSYELPFKR
jgi:hypothetical protein